MIFLNRSRLAHRLTKAAIIAVSLCWHLTSIETGSANTPAPIHSQPQKPTAPKVPVLNNIIVPGKRVGAITANTTYAELVNIFGKQRLTPTKVYGAEGLVVFSGTLITLGKNKSLSVAWKDPKKLQVLQVIIEDPDWKTASGIGIGTNLAKLRQVLGKFNITGLGWDYGNKVINLAPAIQSQYSGLSISVDADRAAARKFPNDLRAVSGDGVTPAANDPRWQNLKMHVSGLSVFFPTTPSKLTPKIK